MTTTQTGGSTPTFPPISRSIDRFDPATLHLPQHFSVGAMVPGSNDAEGTTCPDIGGGAGLNCGTGRPGMQPCWEMALLACSISTNSAEMAGIPWRRVNLTDQPIIVEGQNLAPYSLTIWSNCNRGSVGSTKTKSRYPILPLGSTLVAVLGALKASTDAGRPGLVPPALGGM